MTDENACNVIYHRRSGVIREQGSRHGRRHMERSKGREVRTKQIADVPPLRSKVSTLPCLDQGNGGQQCPGGRIVIVTQFGFFCLFVCFSSPQVR